MKRRTILLGLFVLPLTVTPSLAKPPLVWKTETEFAQELQTSEECKPDDGECQEADHISYVSRSHFGRSYFLTYEEGVRAYISFDAGLDENRDVQFVFASGQLAPGAFDWGGVEEQGAFKPLYVLKRFYDPEFDWSTDNIDSSKSGLFVWRLSSAQPESPTVPLGNAGPDNAKARAMAEADYAKLKQ